MRTASADGRRQKSVSGPDSGEPARALRATGEFRKVEMEGEAGRGKSEANSAARDGSKLISELSFSTALWPRLAADLCTMRGDVLGDRQRLCAAWSGSIGW